MALRVAVIDDDPLEARAVAADVSALGFEPIIVESSDGSVQETAQQISQLADVALIDHRLSYGGWANFDGATLAEALAEINFPAVLITMFKSLDAAGSIRRRRARIPAVLGRDEIEPATLAAALALAQREVAGQQPTERRPYWALLEVEAVDGSGDSKFVDASIPQWRSQHAIRFPLEMVPQQLREGLRRGDSLLAQVNINADDDDDIFITDIQEGPEPDQL